MRKTFRKAMLSTICMLIVGVMSLTGVTYAWFQQGTSGQVSGMEMTVTTAAGGVLISTDGVSYGNNLTVDTSATNVSPVSTIGGENAWQFFTAAVSDSSEKMIKTSAAAPENYIKQNLWFKNEGTSDITVTLGKADGLMTSITLQEGVAFKGHLASRIGIRLAGAVSTLNSNTAVETAKVNGDTYGIFEPNATMHLAGEGSAAETYLGIAAASDQGITEATTGDDAKVKFDGFFDMTFLNGSTVNGVKYLETITPVQDATQFEIVIPAQSIVQVEVYVWLEGQDVDCTNAVSASALDIDLCFELKE